MVRISRDKTTRKLFTPASVFMKRNCNCRTWRVRDWNGIWIERVTACCYTCGKMKEDAVCCTFLRIRLENGSLWLLRCWLFVELVDYLASEPELAALWQGISRSVSVRGSRRSSQWAVYILPFSKFGQLIKFSWTWEIICRMIQTLNRLWKTFRETLIQIWKNWRYICTWKWWVSQIDDARIHEVGNWFTFLIRWSRFCFCSGNTWSICV